MRTILSVAFGICYLIGSAQIKDSLLTTPNYHSLPDNVEYLPYDSSDGFELKMKTVNMPEEDIDTLLLARTIESYNNERIEELLIEADSLTRDPSNRLRYLKILRKVYGPVLNYTQAEGYMATFGKAKFRVEELQVHAEMKNAKGQLIVYFLVTKKGKKFLDISFLPNYYVDVPFFSNTSFLTINLLRSKNIPALIESSTKNFQSSIKNRKKFERELNGYNYDTLIPFSGNIGYSVSTVSLRVVYEMPSADKCLELYYKEEDMKFKLDKLNFIDKKQN